ncbi:aldehyde reductase II [Periconia macrospinosa]|uniref:Aldehyde reductase II n=1 Tax=Periconia macrospinosa TaxID=97972 RepID=A0A2V1DSL5_9PLEO|nr:aldehyde reductase II [Periconia macrospinosa]
MPILELGDLVLVTGANGYIGGVTIQKLLDAGFRVRGTVRDISAPKNAWLQPHYGPNFSLVQVPDVAAPNAFDEAIKGVHGVCHTAASLIFDPDPEIAIAPEINGVMNILNAAATQDTVKRVVYTSSSCAAVQIKSGRKYHLNQSSWNEEAKAAWTLPITNEFSRGFINYEAKKMEGERRAFQWMKDNKPRFEFNSVLPNVNFGTMIRPDKTGFISVPGLLKMLWEGETAFTGMLLPQWYVDVEDTALLHVAALTFPDVVSERLFAYAGRFCWNDVLEIFRKEVPEKKFIDNLEEVPDNGTVENQRSVEILKRLGKKEGFTLLEEAIKKWIPFMLRAEKEGWSKTPTTAEDLRRFD